MASAPVSIYEAKTQLSKLVARVLGGEEIVISRSGVPVARLVPLQSQQGGRRPGSARGQIRIGEDFDDPLPDDVAEALGA